MLEVIFDISLYPSNLMNRDKNHGKFSSKNNNITGLGSR